MKAQILFNLNASGFFLEATKLLSILWLVPEDGEAEAASVWHNGWEESGGKIDNLCLQDGIIGRLLKITMGG